MNITFYSDVTSREKALGFLPQLREHNVKLFKIKDRDLLAQSDFVSLQVAVTDDTKEMADSEFFSKMKSTAYLINTSRGELVDNKALLDALLKNKIAGAGLDVIAPEPVQRDNTLRLSENKPLKNQVNRQN